MKKSSEFLHLPIINMKEGSPIGRVKDLILNPSELSVDFLTIEQNDFNDNAKVVPFKKIVSVGKYAIIMEDTNPIVDISELTFVTKILERNNHLIGSKVITSRGELLGEVFEYEIEEEDGKLNSLFIQSGKDELSVPISEVVSFGECVVIEQDREASKIKNESVVKDKKDEKQQQMSTLREKQIELLKGKTVTKDIYNSLGNIILQKGTILTEEMITTVEAEGDRAFLELSLHVSE